jgi:hypothetical protein
MYRMKNHEHAEFEALHLFPGEAQSDNRWAQLLFSAHVLRYDS